MKNLSCENEFYLHDNKNHFHTYDARFRESAPLYIVHLLVLVKIMYSKISMVLFSVVLSFFCVLIFHCFNKGISDSPKPGMV